MSIFAYVKSDGTASIVTPISGTTKEERLATEMMVGTWCHVTGSSQEIITYNEDGSIEGQNSTWSVEDNALLINGLMVGYASRLTGTNGYEEVIFSNAADTMYWRIK